MKLERGHCNEQKFSYVNYMSESSKKGTHSINGVEIKCLICKNQFFDERKIQLNTTGR